MRLLGRTARALVKIVGLLALARQAEVIRGHEVTIAEAERMNHGFAERLTRERQDRNADVQRLQRQCHLYQQGAHETAVRINATHAEARDLKDTLGWAVSALKTYAERLEAKIDTGRELPIVPLAGLPGGGKEVDRANVAAGVRRHEPTEYR